MQILERATMPNGIQIQLEELGGQLMIGAYPIAQRTINYWIQGGEMFRLTISENQYQGYTNEMVKSDYEALKSGEKSLKDLKSHFWNGNRDAYALGISK